MGNPKLRPTIVVDVGPTPLDAAPHGVLGVRCCDICARCLELGIYGARSAWSNCAWQGRWEFPETGCDRFVFDPAALGQEGLDAPVS